MAFHPPPCDRVDGVLLKLDGKNILVLDAYGFTVPVAPLYRGAVVLRYGWMFLFDEQSDALLPQYVFDDFQQEHHGVDALRLIQRKGASYPRADVVGLRLSDHKQVEHFMRELDLAAGLRVFVYSGEDDRIPLDQLSCVLRVDSSAGQFETDPDPGARLPSLLAGTLPVYRVPPADLEQLPANLRQVL